MKKTFKRAGVAVLSMAMLISMGAVGAMTASAAPSMTAQSITYTITNPEVTNGTYKVYRIASATANGNAYEYTLQSPFESVATIAQLKAETTDTSNRSTSANRANTVKKFASDYAALVSSATALKFDSTDSYKESLSGDTEAVSSGTAVQLVPGYYLIIPNTGTANVIGAPTLVSVTAAAQSLTGKVDTIDIDKKITAVDADTSTNVVSATGTTAIAGRNQAVTYTIETTVPMYDPDVVSLTNHFYIQDIACAGLTLPTSYDNDTSTAAVTVSVAGTEVTGTDGTPDGTASVYKFEGTTGQFTITFNDTYTISHGGETVLVTYTGTVNDSALMYAANTNTAKVSFDNNYATGSGSPVDKTDQTSFFNAKLKVLKTDDANPANPLPNEAKFTVEKDGVYYNTRGASGDTVGSDGTLTINGLPTGTYTITEVEAPTGYTLAGPQSFTITNTESSSEFTATFSNDSTSTDVTVVDTAGATLPGTGGMGTVLFTVGGAAIVLLAGAMFVVYMRRRKNEE